MSQATFNTKISHFLTIRFYLLINIFKKDNLNLIFPRGGVEYEIILKILEKIQKKHDKPI